MARAFLPASSAVVPTFLANECQSARNVGTTADAAGKNARATFKIGYLVSAVAAFQMYAMTSISTSEFPGMPPAAAIVVRTGGFSPKRPLNVSFIPS